MAGGHSQREEIDFKGTFAPIAKFVSLRVLLIRNLTVNKQISSLHSCTVIWKRQYTSGPLTTVSSAWQCLIYSVWDATPFPKHPAQTRGGGGGLVWWSAQPVWLWWTHCFYTSWCPSWDELHACTYLLTMVWIKSGEMVSLCTSMMCRYSDPGGNWQLATVVDSVSVLKRLGPTGSLPACEKRQRESLYSIVSSSPHSTNLDKVPDGK